EQEIAAVARAVNPHDPLVARTTPNEGGEIVRGDRQRDGTKLHFLGDAKRAIDDTTIGRGDHDLAAGRRCRAGRLVRKPEGNEAGVGARERQVPLELEADHLPYFAAQRRQLDWFDGDRRARYGERDRADGQSALLDLGAKRLDGILSGHHENFGAPSLHSGSDETIAERKNSKVSPSKHHEFRLR